MVCRSWCALVHTDHASLKQRKHDPRLTSAIAIEPEYPAAFRATFTDTPTLIIFLGGDATTFAEDWPNISIPGASIFDAFATCTEAGSEILLKEDGDASICDVSSESREKIHKKIAAATTAFIAKKSK